MTVEIAPPGVETPGGFFVSGEQDHSNDLALRPKLFGTRLEGSAKAIRMAFVKRFETLYAPHR